jgi:tryptophan synthase alpha chain
VSKPEHVVMLRDVCDGVIVGSALVRRLEQIGARPADEVITEVQDYIRSLVAALAD